MIRAGTAIVERIVPIREAKKINAQITNPAINERKISLKAAFRALPEYFICLQGTIYALRVKGKVLDAMFAQSRSSALYA
jgi:hypothetical protein